MKKLLAVMCMVVSTVASGSELLDVARDLGRCTAAEFHMTQDKERFNERYDLAVATMGKKQFGIYGYGMGLIDGIAMAGENHLIVEIYNECKAKHNM